MDHITSKLYANLSRCDESEKKVVKEGLDACRAFWLAAQNLPNYEIEQARPHSRCIYAALAVRDILNRRGVVRAEVYTCGLYVQLVDPRSGSPKSTITIGNPAGYSSQQWWNAHLVVRAGRFLFDPTLKQVSRPWNRLPHIGCFDSEAPDWHSVYMNAGVAKSTAVASCLLNDHRLEIAYFDIPNVAGFEARSYKTSSNSGARQRRDVVAEALIRMEGIAPASLDEIAVAPVAFSPMGRKIAT